MYKTVVVFRVKNYFYVLTRKTINRLNSKISLNLPWVPVPVPGTFHAWQRKLLAPTKLLAYLTTISRKVVGKNVHAKVSKGNMGYDQHTVPVPDTVAVEPTFVAFFSSGKHKFMASLAFFQISLKSSELKTTHNTFRDCRVHFFRQPFSKYLYIACVNFQVD